MHPLLTKASANRTRAHVRWQSANIHRTTDDQLNLAASFHYVSTSTSIDVFHCQSFAIVGPSESGTVVCTANGEWSDGASSKCAVPTTTTTTTTFTTATTSTVTTLKGPQWQLVRRVAHRSRSRHRVPAPPHPACLALLVSLLRATVTCVSASFAPPV